jgi:hypothetical protein
MLFHEQVSIERGGIGLAPVAAEIAAGALVPEIAVEAGGSEVGANRAAPRRSRLYRQAAMHIR